MLAFRSRVETANPGGIAYFRKVRTPAGHPSVMRSVRWPATLVKPSLAALATLFAALPAARAGGATSPELRVDGGMIAALPAALPTGVSTGIGAGAMRGRWLAWGARAAWSRATEYSTAFTVKHSDLRLHLAGALQHSAGRGTISLRLAAGGTLVHEKRRRDQGERAGLTGDALETSAWRMLPTADLEVATSLRVVGSWGVVVSGGPSVCLRGGSAHGGWIAGLGVAWQP